MRDVRVLFFGDSYTAGVGDATGLGWTGRLAAVAAAEGLPVTGYPLGVRGETSIQVAARWRAEARVRMLAPADHRLVLCVGANDVAPGEDGGRRVASVATVAAVAQLLDDARGLELPCLLVGPPPAGDVRQRERAVALAGGLASACAARSVPFADVTAALASSAVWRRECMAGDGAHPGSGGYAELAALVRDAGWLRFVA